MNRLTCLGLILLCLNCADSGTSSSGQNGLASGDVMVIPAPEMTTDSGTGVQDSAVEDVAEIADVSEPEVSEDISSPDDSTDAVGDDSVETEAEKVEDDADVAEATEDSNEVWPEDIQESELPDVVEVFDYPDNLRVNHVQALGTHNSYHLLSPLADLIYPWNYEHLPLDEQMGVQGIRQFELDLYYNEDDGVFEVYHIIGADQETNCPYLGDCLAAIRKWSDANLAHHPFLVLLELKSSFSEEKAPGMLDDLDAKILEFWPWERLVTPDLIQGEHANVRDGLIAEGWPSINAVRGRGIFVLHAGGEFASAYIGPDESTAGKPLFPDAYGDVNKTYGAIHSMNDPIGGQDQIQAIVAHGHLVRTRSDSNSEEPLDGDYSRFEAALSSGAHFISTDYPGEPYGETYAVQIPEGTPSACNPISAPEDCTSEGLETGLWNP